MREPADAGGHSDGGASQLHSAIGSIEFTVGEGDTALALGSGDVPVLATPRVIAWLEAATVAASARLLSAGQTSVGTKVEVEHVRATGVGKRVRATACVERCTHRAADFVVAAYEVAAGEERLIAEGFISRAIVEREAFLAKVARSS